MYGRFTDIWLIFVGFPIPWICPGLTHQIIDKSRCLAGGGESQFSGHFGTCLKDF